MQPFGSRPHFKKCPGCQGRVDHMLFLNIDCFRFTGRTRRTNGEGGPVIEPVQQKIPDGPFKLLPFLDQAIGQFLQIPCGTAMSVEFKLGVDIFIVGCHDRRLMGSVPYYGRV